jgi:response regulator RpfG family c-di-GMP phosphodiesterase
MKHTVVVPQTANILIVDDEKDIRETLLQGIAMAGYDCYMADGGIAALELMAEQEIDVVVSDINMLEMDGIELLRNVRERFDSDVIIMTGYIDDFTYEEIVGLGASDFIQKPARIKEVVARIRRVLKERKTFKDRNMALEALQENLEQFRNAMVGTIRAISLAIELRDPYTAGHQLRVAELACAIGEELNLSEDVLYGLHMASVLHDLGKITIPAEILTRPGGLNDLEYGIIQNHVQAGFDIIKKIECPWPLAEIVLQHHERMDGSGYPNSLKGEEILLEARILAVADVLETISSHRPYRPSLGINKAVEEIVNNKGILYDEEVVNACTALVEEKGFKFKPVAKRQAEKRHHGFNI